MVDVAEGAFLDLKRQLETFEYGEPLGIESAPLVRRLLDDLIVTTENYELLRQRSEALEQELATTAERYEPLERENARLVRENNRVRAGRATSACTSRSPQVHRRFRGDVHVRKVGMWVGVGCE
jgi:hypothetical protein